MPHAPVKSLNVFTIEYLGWVRFFPWHLMNAGNLCARLTRKNRNEYYTYLSSFEVANVTIANGKRERVQRSHFVARLQWCNPMTLHFQSVVVVGVACFAKETPRRLEFCVCLCSMSFCKFLFYHKASCVGVSRWGVFRNVNFSLCQDVFFFIKERLYDLMKFMFDEGLYYT